MTIPGMATFFLSADPMAQISRQITRSLQRDPAIASATVQVIEGEEGLDLTAAIVVRRTHELTRVVDHVTDDLLPLLEADLGRAFSTHRLDFVLPASYIPFGRSGAPTVVTVS